MRSYRRRLSEAFFVLVAALCLASPWQFDASIRGQRNVASLPQAIPMNSLLSTPLGGLAYKNAAWDVLSPMDPALLSAAMEELRPYAYQPAVANSWDDIRAMNVQSFGKQLDNIMNFAGYQVQRNRQIWGNQYAHTLGRDLLSGKPTSPSLGGSAPSLFAGGVSANGAVPWGAGDANLTDLSAPLTVPTSIFPEYNGRRRSGGKPASIGSDRVAAQVGDTVFTQAHSAYDPRSSRLRVRGQVTTGKSAPAIEDGPVVGFSAQ